MGQNLEWAYFDPAPMVAYFICLTLSPTRRAVGARLRHRRQRGRKRRHLAPGAAAVAKNEAVAAGSVILFNTFPLTVLGLLIVTPDVAAVLFWSLGVLLFWRSPAANSRRWYVGGWCGWTALLSKYTAC